MLELVRRALLYRKNATPAVVLHVESDLYEHANGHRKRRTCSASSAAHLRSSHARWALKAMIPKNIFKEIVRKFKKFSIFCEHVEYFE